MTPRHTQKSYPHPVITATKSFRAIPASDLPSLDLASELETHGYVLIRNLIPPADILPLLTDVTEVLNKANWLAPRTNPTDRIANRAAACSEDDPNADYREVRHNVFSLPRFQGLPHHPALTAMMKQLTGPELLILPRPAPRLIFPDYEPGIIHAHQDYNPAAGHHHTFTAWMPLHDCPINQGPLRILEGSHRYGIQPDPTHTGFIPAGTERGDAWAIGAIHAGDVLLFNNLTIHEAAPNTSNRLRLSLDCRFQSYLHPTDPALYTFVAGGGRSWESTYANWPASYNHLKFYWTHLPLNFKPSIADLANLIQTAPSPRDRARYANVLHQITAQNFANTSSTREPALQS